MTVGDVVYLKSGSKPLMVMNIIKTEAQVYCSFSANWMICPLACLTLTDPRIQLENALRTTTGLAAYKIGDPILSNLF